MQLVLSNNRVIAHGENFISMGSVVINTETDAKYENATVADCDGCPSDIDSVGYEYHSGIFKPCAPYGKATDGTILIACEECKTPRDSGLLLSDLLPVGSFFWFTSETVPKGFLLCDGSALLKEDYPALYSVIGSSFEVETETEFYLPDMRAKFVRGAGVCSLFSATFGATQDASYIFATSDRTLGCSSADYIQMVDGTTYTFNVTSPGGSQQFAVRPYNIALTPIIKY